MKLRVEYAKSSYKDKTYATPLVRYAYRDEFGTPRHRTVVSLAKFPKPIVKVIDVALKRGDTSVLEEIVLKSEIKFKKSNNIGAAFAAIAVLLQLNIVAMLHKCLGKASCIAVLAFILERIIAGKPLSISALQRQFEGSPEYYVLGSPPIPHLNTWYNALEKLEQSREKILVDLFNRKPTADKVFLYDITSSYFEGDKCPLSEYGYNRDGKKGKKQVVVGVICDSAGRPVWCDVFKGSTSDQTTVKLQLTNLKDKLGVKEFVFVGDRGMVTNARIDELGKEGWWETFGYITALKRREIFSLIDDAGHPMQPELFDHRELVEIEHGGERFVLCHNPFKRSQDRRTREDLLDKTEKKLAMISRNVKAGRLKARDKIARRLYRWVDKWNMERFFDVRYGEGMFEYSRKAGEIDRYSALDGCYVIRARLHSGSMDKGDLLRQYKDLKYVEQSFRTMKTTDINMRPFRVWTEQHVRGYIFGCFLAYSATWEIRSRLALLLERDKNGQCDGGSLQEIFRSLSRVSVGIYDIAGEEHIELSEIPKGTRRILKHLKLPEISSVLGKVLKM